MRAAPFVVIEALKLLHFDQPACVRLGEIIFVCPRPRDRENQSFLRKLLDGNGADFLAGLSECVLFLSQRCSWILNIGLTGTELMSVPVLFAYGIVLIVKENQMQSFPSNRHTGQMKE